MTSCYGIKTLCHACFLFISLFYKKISIIFGMSVFFLHAYDSYLILKIFYQEWETGETLYPMFLLCDIPRT